MFDISRIEDDEFYIDLGSMYGIPSKPSEVDGEPKVGYTAVPRLCCLEDLVARFNNLIPDGIRAPKINGSYYTWGLTKDVTALTIEPPPNHPLRRLGLCYLQIYPSHKNLFDCQSHYPYPSDDDGGVCLALDDDTLKALYSTVGRPTPDRNACRRSWRHSGRRIGVALQSHSNRSFFVRIELRATRTLMRKVFAEICMPLMCRYLSK